MTVAELEEHLRGLDPTSVISVDVDGFPKPVKEFETFLCQPNRLSNIYRTVCLIPGEWPEEPPR